MDKKLFKTWYLILIFTALFFRKIVFGLVPIPFELLVKWFFPYNSGGWQAIGIWDKYKGGQYASDAIRQLYPWKELAIEIMSRGQLPLWNPYNFSGTPLLANAQTAIFYPLNIIFFIIPSFAWAWAVYIMLPILLSGLFMFKFLTTIKTGKFGATFGSLAFASSGYIVSWLEWGVVAHSIIWLPLSLYSVNRWIVRAEKKFLILLIISLSSTVFAGYPQGSAYSIITVFSYFLFLLIKKKKSKRRQLAFPTLTSALFVIGITAVQWIPTTELFINSAMKGNVSQTLSREAAMPLPHFATLLAPDYFGNRVTENYWAKTFSNLDYMDADLFTGVSLFSMAVFAFISRKKIKLFRWIFMVLVLGVFLGSKNPASALVANLGIPVISTGAASEALIMTIFGTWCLGAMGFSQFRRHYDRKKFFYSLGIVAILLFVLSIGTFFVNSEFATISRRNLVIPFATFFAFSTVVILFSKQLINKSLTGFFIIILIAAELLLHANKILPFSSTAFAFPQHLLIEELRKKADLNRIAGFWESEITTNFHTAFRLYSAEGYDPLYIRRYGEFITSAKEDKLEKNIPRADADITMENEANRDRILDLSSIKYIPAKLTDPSQTWEEEPLKYNPERYKLVWQQDKFKIYENFHSLPRASLYYDWQIIQNDEDIINVLYDPQHNIHKQVILESDPGIEKKDNGKGEARIITYDSNQIQIETDSNQPAVLLLTDSYYPGWTAEVDGSFKDILRANYTFKAIVIPTGKHTIKVSYRPSSIKLGITISTISIAGTILFLLYYPKKPKMIL
jgi:hypothetical protein